MVLTKIVDDIKYESRCRLALLVGGDVIYATLDEVVKDGGLA